jgi:riboflavin kinase/FMN adenylyltransferase
MELYCTLNEIKEKPKVVLAVGSFDGLHLGHQKIIKTVCTEAKRRNAKSMIITFSPTPREVFSGLQEIALMKPEEKSDAIHAMGVDIVCLKHFDLEYAKMGPDKFLKRLLTYLDLTAIVAGPDHSIGNKEEGGINYLKKASETYHFDLIVVPKTQYKGEEISSQLIRKTLKTGRIEDVNAMMDHPYRISGTVVPGLQRGRTLGFPTLNIKPDLQSCMIPAYGVYCVKVHLEDADYQGICNIGERPTFDEGGLSMEVHVFDVDLDHQYGKAVEIYFMRYIRNERKFDSKDALIKQIKNDIEKCKMY